MYSNVCSSFIHNLRKLETTPASINWCKERQIVIRPYSEIRPRDRKEHISDTQQRAAKWKKPDCIIIWSVYPEKASSSEEEQSEIAWRWRMGDENRGRPPREHRETPHPVSRGWKPPVSWMKLTTHSCRKAHCAVRRVLFYVSYMLVFKNSLQLFKQKLWNLCPTVSLLLYWPT